jgi:nucleoside diphosphate kinase
MTDRERAIKLAEKRAMAEVRGWKMRASKSTQGMSPEEVEAFYKRQREERIKPQDAKTCGGA